jgi:hypothetical protein
LYLILSVEHEFNMCGDRVPGDYIDPRRDENVSALVGSDRVVAAGVMVQV